MLQNELEVEDRDLTPLERIFREQFPPLRRFVGDAEFLDFDSAGLALSDIQHDLVRHAEQVLKPETYIEMVKDWGIEYAPVRNVNSLVACWGKGSGKDMTVQIAFARVANILLSMNDAHSYYHIPKHVIIHMMNVAASSKQAHGVFFKPLRTLLINSPWFEDKFEGDIPSDKSTEIFFKGQIELVSGHSDAETLEGKNLIMAVADEIAAFKMEKDARGGTAASKTAEGLVDMLKSSASTRFPENYKLLQISYPRSKGDAILTALNKAKASEELKGDKSTEFSSGPFKTWDVNPRYIGVERVKIPGLKDPVPNFESIIEDYTSSIAFAQAKYECKPDAAVNRFFKDDAAIEESFNVPNDPPPVSFEYHVGVDRAEDGKVEQWQCKYEFDENFWPKNGALYAIHADMAVTGDRAGVAMSHVEGYNVEVDPETKEEIYLPRVTVDFATYWAADAGAVHPLTDRALPREIQIRWFRGLVMELIRRGFPIESVSMDGFQSVDSLQILASRGLEARKYSLDRTPEGYKTLRDVMYSGRLTGPQVHLLIEEIAALNKFNNGKIDHLPGGSKDIADAVAGSVVGAIVIGGEEEEEGEETPAVAAYESVENSVWSNWGDVPLDSDASIFGGGAARSPFGQTFGGMVNEW
jgi:hypothetical protein